MPTLHVRSVPEDLYARLQQRAAAQQRSLSAQVITLLEQALSAEQTRQRQSKLLARIRRRRAASAYRAPDSVRLLREDRQR